MRRAARTSAPGRAVGLVPGLLLAAVAGAAGVQDPAPSPTPAPSPEEAPEELPEETPAPPDEEAPVETPPETADRPAPRTLAEARPELLRLMRAGLEVHEPNASFTRALETDTIFDGSYDWHSSVIAHWALMVAARQDGDADLSDWLARRLSLEVLTRELEVLERRSRLLAERGRKWAGTWPYDEVWFALLLTERRRHHAADDVTNGLESRPELDALRDRLLARLLPALEELSFPETWEGKGPEGHPYCGFYRSWLWAWNVLARTLDPRDPECARLLAWHAEHVVPELAAGLAQAEAHPYDFLWVPALFELSLEGVERLGGPAIDDERPAYDLGPEPTWPASVEIATVHVLGMELSRLWPVLLRLGPAPREGEPAADTELRAACQARLASFLARTDLWAGDFACCSHWLPQYLFLCSWFEAGCP